MKGSIKNIPELDKPIPLNEKILNLKPKLQTQILVCLSGVADPVERRLVWAAFPAS